MAEAFHQGFEIHGDERLVLDDQDFGRHVGGEFPARLVDQITHLVHVHIEDHAGIFLGEAFEAGEQERLPGQRGDLAEPNLGRQVVLHLIAVTVDGE